MNLFSRERISITKQTDSILRIEKTVKGAIYPIIATIITLIILFLAYYHSPLGTAAYWKYGLPLLGIISILRTIKPIKTLLLGSFLEFDKRSNLLITQNSKHALSEISHVELAEYNSKDSHNEYSVSIRMKNKKRIKIDRSANEEEISDTCHEISFFLGCKIKKNNSWDWKESIGLN